jgi:hypothetical protein
VFAQGAFQILDPCGSDEPMRDLAECAGMSVGHVEKSRHFHTEEKSLVTFSEFQTICPVICPLLMSDPFSSPPGAGSDSVDQPWTYELGFPHQFFCG